MKNKILLVGNGSSLLDKENQKTIDSYQTVVRFNSYKINGYEKYVGTKTNIWVTVNRAHKNEIFMYDKVLTHSWTKTDCKLQNDLQELRKDVEKINYDIINQIPIKHPSTGLIAIYYFNTQVDIIGFDWWYKEKHHYGDSEVRGNLHNPESEYKLIKELNVNIIN